MAILGSIPNEILESADEIAISANCSAVGFGLIAQSPKTETRSSKHIKNTEETTDEFGFVLMNCSAGKMVCCVVCAAPETIPSAWPLYTIIVPKYETSSIKSLAI